VIRVSFLRYGVSDCIRLLLPSLLSFNSNGQFEEVSLSTLALQPNRILFLDHHTNIFIWSGRLVNRVEYDVFREACRHRAIQFSSKRLPAPSILNLAEGHPDSQSFIDRLTPSHKDPPGQRLVDFPQLAQLSEEVLNGIIASLPPSSNLSFHEYCGSIEKNLSL